MGLGKEISNNHGIHYVLSRDRHVFYQDEFMDNYMGVCRKIERHSLVDTEHQEDQWALQAFHDRELLLPNLIID